MIRKIFTFLFVAAIAVSCSNSGNKQASAPDGTDEAVKVEFTSLVNDPGSYIDKNISVEGKVVHVCTMSGKKMFIVGENPDIRLFVSAGEDMPKFPMELLGSEIVVQGKLTQVTAAAMMEGEGVMEGGMKEGEGMKMAAGDSCETEAALAAQPVLSDLMMVYSAHKVK